MADAIITKLCRTCNTEKPVSEFFIDARRGLPRSRCKPCHIQAKRAYERRRGVPSKAELARARAKASLEKIPSEPTLELLEQNARDAWKYHVKVMASDEWRAGYFEAKRKSSLETERKRWRDRYQENPGREIHRSKQGKDKIRQATPHWADQDKIKAVYLKAGELRAQGFDVHVDHIIPLKGKLVCGLHVHSNLQITHAKDNFAKRNHFTPGDID